MNEGARASIAMMLRTSDTGSRQRSPSRHSDYFERFSMCFSPFYFCGFRVLSSVDQVMTMTCEGGHVVDQLDVVLANLASCQNGDFLGVGACGCLFGHGSM